MKIFVSVDMEGASAITDPEDVLPDGADHHRAGRMVLPGLQAGQKAICG